MFKVGAYAAALGAIQPDFVRATPDKAYLSAVISSGISGLTSFASMRSRGAISVGYAYAAARQVGEIYQPNHGAITDNSALNCAIIRIPTGMAGW